ncbi:MAG: DNA-3-methyladenine glycosylase 2 family protein [Anaerolineaceae bacterium]
MIPPEPLSDATLLTDCRKVAQRDPDLAEALARFGFPPLWARPQGCPTLVHIILEQQVSLESAQAAFDRLRSAAGILTPQRFLEFDDAALKTIGFSRQKTGYVRQLAQALLDGELDLAELADMDDEAVRAALIRMKGIGLWTANTYLLMALLRPDVLPSGDRALVLAVQRVKRLPTCPTSIELEAMSQSWRPWRSAAVRIFWQFYLNGGMNDMRWQMQACV